ncbi:MAG TPA: alpha/beta fold hydrolase [Thermoanaerobaculia bacterium]|nr:alpha/beta fold hydrolase [Thermoanaerobaculia bacterium]
MAADPGLGEEHRLGLGGGEDVAVRFAAPQDAELAILYLHGFGSCQDGEKAAYFRRRALASGFAFCSFDFRGHGRSGGSLADLTMTRNLDDAEAVAAWLGERWSGPMAFFGSSMGAAAGLWLAARRPKGPAGRLGAGVCIAPALHLRRSLAERCGPEGLAHWRRTGRLRMSTDLVSADLGWCLMDDLATYPAAELAPLQRAPALILQGSADESVDWREVAAFAAACPVGSAVELHLFAGGDHRLISWKDRLWELAAGFLRPRPG